jgi:hypothetical protein
MAAFKGEGNKKVVAPSTNIMAFLRYFLDTLKRY